MNIIKSRKNKNNITRPDFVLQDIPMAERANLPQRMKILFWLNMRGDTIPAWMFEDCRRKFPQYFEKEYKLYGRTK